AVSGVAARLVVINHDHDKLIAVDQGGSSAVGAVNFERKESRLRVQEIADPLGTGMTGASAGREEASVRRLAARQRQDSVRTLLLDEERRREEFRAHASGIIGSTPARPMHAVAHKCTTRFAHPGRMSDQALLNR